MTSLSDWSDSIRRIGEENERKQLERLKKMEEELPGAIEDLGKVPNGMLIDLFAQFHGGRSDPRETVLREKFFEAIKDEILRRMDQGASL